MESDRNNELDAGGSRINEQQVLVLVPPNQQWNGSEQTV